MAFLLLHNYTDFILYLYKKEELYNVIGFSYVRYCLDGIR